MAEMVVARRRYACAGGATAGEATVKRSIWRIGVSGAAALVFVAATWGAVAAPRATPRTFLLAPAWPEAPRSAQARGIFYQQAYVVAIDAAEVVLASSADGKGELCTDDQATVSFVSSAEQTLVWTHRFTRSDRRGIACISPQIVRLPAIGETYTITVVLEDVFPDTLSTQPYYLVVNEALSLPEPSFTDEAIGVSAPTTLPTATAVLPPTALQQNAATSTLPVRVPTSAPARNSPIADARVAPNTARASTAATAVKRAHSAGVLLPAASLLLVLILLALPYLARRRSQRAPLHAGIVDLVDRETCEARIALLSVEGRGLEIRRRPLRIAASGDHDDPDPLLARVVVTDLGPELQVTASTGSAPAFVLLQPNLPHTLAGGLVVLRYRPVSGGVRQPGSPTTSARKP